VRYVPGGAFPRDERANDERELVEKLTVDRVPERHQWRDQIFLVLAPVISALTGKAVVTFCIWLTKRIGCGCTQSRNSD
jgi:hypothetical protein